VDIDSTILKIHLDVGKRHHKGIKVMRKGWWDTIIGI
jgi:hypothetical protein